MFGYMLFINVSAFSPASFALISVPITPPVIPPVSNVVRRRTASITVEIAQ